MKIVQVLNNNVAVVEDHGGRPEIVMGTGLAFGKKKGDAVEDKKVEATFKMHDEHAVDDLSTLLKDVPADFIEASYSLIEQSQEKYDFAVEGYLYVTLTMHLYSAYQRLKEGRYRANNSLPDLSDKYPEAYKIADEFLAGFKERLRVDFPASECDSMPCTSLMPMATRLHKQSRLTGWMSRFSRLSAMSLEKIASSATASITLIMAALWLT